MDLEGEVAEVERSLAEAEGEAFRWTARAEVLRAQLHALGRAVERSENPVRQGDTTRDLRLLNRSAAIVEVLRVCGAPMGIYEVMDALRAAGRRGDNYAVVASTLQQLLNQGRVERPLRGRYLV
jgi:hypothetical protein